MNAIARHNLGRTQVSVTQVGFGGAPLGELFEKVPEDQAQETLGAAWDEGVRFYDTAPFYGYGLSEHRTGHFLRQRPRDEYVLSTKVGRVLTATRDLGRWTGGLWAGGLAFEYRFDYSYDGILRSWEDSLQRLGLQRVDALLIHDLDTFFQTTDRKLSAYESQLYTSGWRALEELRRDGLIGAVGAGINHAIGIARLLDLVDLDFFVVAMPYTLLDQGVLDDEFPRCQERGVGVVIGSPFASGILATGPVPGAKYGYAPAPPEVLEKTRRIEAVCNRHGVPLTAAALRFPLAHPIVAAVIPGGFRPEHPRQNLAAFRREIPPALWAQLKAEGLIRADAPTP